MCIRDREYLSTFSLLVENDSAGYTREMMLDADQLNFFLNDRARASEIVKAIEKEEKEKEKEQQKAKEPQKKEPLKKARKEQLPTPEPLTEGIPVKEVPPKEIPAKEIPSKEIPAKEIPAKEPEPGTVTLPEPAEKKPARTQSTLFDGF